MAGSAVLKEFSGMDVRGTCQPEHHRLSEPMRAHPGHTPETSMKTLICRISSPFTGIEVNDHGISPVTGAADSTTRRLCSLRHLPAISHCLKFRQTLNTYFRARG